MPRGPRLDAPGVLHHIIIRGIGHLYRLRYLRRGRCHAFASIEFVGLPCLALGPPPPWETS